MNREVELTCSQCQKTFFDFLPEEGWQEALAARMESDSFRCPACAEIGVLGRLLISDKIPDYLPDKTIWLRSWDGLSPGWYYIDTLFSTSHLPPGDDS